MIHFCKPLSKYVKTSCLLPPLKKKNWTINYNLRAQKNYRIDHPSAIFPSLWWNIWASPSQRQRASTSEVSHLRLKVNHGLGHFRVHLHLPSKTRKDLQTWLQFSWSPSLHSCHTVIQLTHYSQDVNLLTCTLLLGRPKCFRRALHGSAPPVSRLHGIL